MKSVDVTVDGCLVSVGDIQYRTRYKFRDIVIQETGGKFPSTWKVRLSKEHVHDIELYKIGDYIEISGFLRGYYYEKDGVANCFVNIHGTQITGNAIGE